MKHSAVLFDLDGTLLDTIEDLTDSMNAALDRHDAPTHTVADYKRFVGDGILALVRRAAPESLRTDEGLASLLAAMRDEYSRRWDNKTHPYEGVPELLDALVARDVRIAVLSNKPQDSTIDCVRKLLPRWEFSAILGAREGVARKPSPVGALEIAARLGIDPERFLYCGDTNTDMQTGVAAGMFPVGVAWGFRAADELLKNGAQAVIEWPLDLLELV